MSRRADGECERELVVVATTTMGQGPACPVSWEMARHACASCRHAGVRTLAVPDLPCPQRHAPSYPKQWAPRRQARTHQAEGARATPRAAARIPEEIVDTPAPAAAPPPAPRARAQAQRSAHLHSAMQKHNALARALVRRLGGPGGDSHPASPRPPRLPRPPAEHAQRWQ